MTRPARLTVPSILFTALLSGLTAAPVAHAQAPAPGRPALDALQSHLDALKDVQTLTARFVCEKRIAMLESPLISAGQLSIRKSDPQGAGGAVRFSTTVPYVSDLILADGKVHGRSQHETAWTTSNQAARPGLSAVMVQLGGWSTGNAGKLSDMYSISHAPPEAVIPAPPRVEGVSTRTVKTGNEGIDTFILTPTNKDLAIAIKSIEIAMDRASHKLLSIQVTTAQDDATRYWFYDVQLNPNLPADTFKPGPATVGPEKTGGARERP